MKFIILILSFSLLGCVENLDIQELQDKENNISEGKLIASYTDMIGINEAEYNDLKMKPDGYIEENNIETYQYELNGRISSIKGQYTGLNFRDLNNDRFIKEAQGIIKMMNFKIFDTAISEYDFKVTYDGRELI